MTHAAQEPNIAQTVYLFEVSQFFLFSTLTLVMIFFFFWTCLKHLGSKRWTQTHPAATLTVAVAVLLESFLTKMHFYLYVSRLFLSLWFMSTYLQKCLRDVEGVSVASILILSPDPLTHSSVLYLPFR